ncbi:MAG: hypothetical protein IPL36_09815 [Nigerium sp.]|nr:hypothetical protein [Nigerium sp.]
MTGPWGTALVATTVLLGLVASGTITIHPAAAQADAATATPTTPNAELTSPPPSADPEDSPDVP